MSSKESNSWYSSMKEEMNSMASNRVWDLVAKGFNQREGIDYTKTFSPVSKKYSLRIFMALCKTQENSNFLKKGKMAISVKIQNFSRSRMTK